VPSFTSRRTISAADISVTGSLWKKSRRIGDQRKSSGPTCSTESRMDAERFTTTNAQWIRIFFVANGTLSCTTPESLHDAARERMMKIANSARSLMVAAVVLVVSADRAMATPIYTNLQGPDAATELLDFICAHGSCDDWATKERDAAFAMLLDLLKEYQFTPDPETGLTPQCLTSDVCFVVTPHGLNITGQGHLKPSSDDVHGPSTEEQQLAVTAIPEPATLILLGSGIAGLVARGRRQRQSTKL
jgi:hypothetical protein